MVWALVTAVQAVQLWPDEPAEYTPVTYLTTGGEVWGCGGGRWAWCPPVNLALALCDSDANPDPDLTARMWSQLGL